MTKLCVKKPFTVLVGVIMVRQEIIIPYLERQEAVCQCQHNGSCGRDGRDSIGAG